MKNVLIFIAGIILGITLVELSYYGKNDQLILSEENEKILSIYEMNVFQVIGEGGALVKSGKFPNEQIYLLLHNEADLYYDNQKIQVSKGMKVKQVGIYRYKNKEDFILTVPAIRIEQINSNQK